MPWEGLACLRKACVAVDEDGGGVGFDVCGDADGALEDEAGVLGGTRDAAGPVGGWTEGAGFAVVAEVVFVLLVFGVMVVAELSAAFVLSPGASVAGVALGELVGVVLF